MDKILKLSEIIQNQAVLNVGCIGHVSNGKSTLVRQMTGIKTQKFKSERERNCTINVGYANCKIFYSDKDKINTYLKNNIFGIGHHMGTTRMGFSKEDSVCDLNLKYHGINNLYINSTSVFPTGGIANPTLTLLALTSRLAENLNND